MHGGHACEVAKRAMAMTAEALTKKRSKQADAEEQFGAGEQAVFTKQVGGEELSAFTEQVDAKEQTGVEELSGSTEQARVELFDTKKQAESTYQVGTRDKPGVISRQVATPSAECPSPPDLTPSVESPSVSPLSLDSLS